MNDDDYTAGYQSAKKILETCGLDYLSMYYDIFCQELCRFNDGYAKCLKEAKNAKSQDA